MYPPRCGAYVTVRARGTRVCAVVGVGGGGGGGNLGGKRAAEGAAGSTVDGWLGGLREEVRPVFTWTLLKNTTAVHRRASDRAHNIIYYMHLPYNIFILATVYTRERIARCTYVVYATRASDLGLWFYFCTDRRSR